ncbi:uncharacterized protein Gasu_28110 [Galdieria sulphuraria]|uniref:Uncharacterized protein n=1 Tax=Galdieria sulphuraria TaxID=130081 RepID=M2Y1W9_GALSU|nr:uncharacterized protein Gasu_28110 [Galdieria sulphuraria]EME29809.1 hypothetical protein Gasu_28110 [Galdieria sulphuraria]|eukprot:XP_005706329.1 hypothetical protein Gasu_28110 [Galdieria sulphuraria]
MLFFVTCGECVYGCQKRQYCCPKWQTLSFRLREKSSYRLHKTIKAEQSQPKFVKTGKGFQTTVVKGKEQRNGWKEEEEQTNNYFEPGSKDNLHNSGSLPPIVSDRMGKRMLYASSVPFMLFIVFFASVFVAKLQFDITVIPSLVAYSSLLLILATMAALSYGIFSASWDVEQEGSFWGWNEFRVNVGRTLEGFKSNSRGKK